MCCIVRVLHKQKQHHTHMRFIVFKSRFIVLYLNLKAPVSQAIASSRSAGWDPQQSSMYAPVWIQNTSVSAWKQSGRERILQHLSLQSHLWQSVYESGVREHHDQDSTHKQLEQTHRWWSPTQTYNRTHHKNFLTNVNPNNVPGTHGKGSPSCKSARTLLTTSVTFSLCTLWFQNSLYELLPLFPDSAVTGGMWSMVRSTQITAPTYRFLVFSDKLSYTEGPVSLSFQETDWRMPTHIVWAISLLSLSDEDFAKTYSPGIPFK